MRGAALPAALLCVALGLSLAFAPRRAIAPALAGLVVASIGAHLISWPPQWHEAAFLGCWASVILIAGSGHLPRGVPFTLAIALGVDAGLWAGAVVAYEGRTADLASAFPFALLFLPARLFVARGWEVAVKVAASWLVAVAILVALLPLQTTPGYVPDHME